MRTLRSPQRRCRTAASNAARPATATPAADVAAALAAAGLRPSGRETTLCSLWAGYGKVTSVDVVDEATNTKRPIVVKCVSPPAAPRDDQGHARKLDSYVAEAAFYRDVAPRLAGSDSRCPVAAPLAVVEAGHGEDGSYSLALALSDLRPSFPIFTRGGLKPPQIKAALTWLAGFHAAHWGLADRSDVPPLLKQRQGTFWHLATRPEEYDSIPSDWSDLKAAAHAIDARLRHAAAGPHGVLVHGDAKAANFCWSPDGKNAAAFDFQYVGAGVGAQDVAYLLSSAGTSRDADEDDALAFYLDELLKALAAAGTDPAGYDMDTLREHYDLAAADFVRFMAGWGWWGGGSDRAAKTARRVAREVNRSGA